MSSINIVNISDANRTLFKIFSENIIADIFPDFNAFFHARMCGVKIYRMFASTNIKLNFGSRK